MKFSLLFLCFSITCFSQVEKSSYDLIPWPKNVSSNLERFVISSDFGITITGNPNVRIYSYANRFLRRLDNRTGLFFKQGIISKSNNLPNKQLIINCLNEGKIDINQDESYTLEVTEKNIFINAHSDLGAMHAMETLLQLLNTYGNQFIFPSIKIEDNPRFTWRGLMIDSARHFQPIDVIKRNLDAMAALKLNVFHWHLTDDQGWRIQIKSLPQLTTLASDGEFYTQEEIKQIVSYANDRGIMVIPEIDVPGHATAILTALPEIGSAYSANGEIKKYNLERNAGIFNPTLDPSNPKTYSYLELIFNEVCALFPSKYFHIGGDENEGKDWDANPKIQAFKRQHNLKTNHDLQTYFNMQLLKIMDKKGKKVIGWEEIMTPTMSKDAIIHSWKGPNEGMPTGQSLINAAKSGYKTILSNGFYIDLMLSIKDHYAVEIVNEKSNLSEEEKKRILGGEATMWSELVTPLTIDSRIWPRTIAIAERLWSENNISDIDFLYKRLPSVSYRLEELGITHLKNKEVILRNICNNQNTEAVKTLSRVCEPLKKYSRNKGGTEYQSYSPLTLFADLCTPDAEDAILFEKLTNNYLNNENDLENKKSLIAFLDKWINIDDELIIASSKAPLILSLLPISKNLKNISIELKNILLKNSSINKEQLEQYMTELDSKNYADVELAISDSFKKLIKKTYPN